MRIIDHLIAGAAGDGAGGGRTGNVFDPNTGRVQAQVTLGTPADLDRAVAAAQTVQPAWAATNPQRRARVLFRFEELAERDMTRRWPDGDAALSRGAEDGGPARVCDAFVIPMMG